MYPQYRARRRSAQRASERTDGSRMADKPPICLVGRMYIRSSSVRPAVHLSSVERACASARERARVWSWRAASHRDRHKGRRRGLGGHALERCRLRAQMLRLLLQLLLPQYRQTDRLLRCQMTLLVGTTTRRDSPTAVSLSLSPSLACSPAARPAHREQSARRLRGRRLTERRCSVPRTDTQTRGRRWR